jgi:hypothetical protein
MREPQVGNGNSSGSGSDASLQGQSLGLSDGNVEGPVHVSTGDLPGGMPEEEMKDSKEHSLLHMGKKKWTSS